jgi:hypothetical protein
VAKSLQKSAQPCRHALAALMEGFANHTGGRWDWDYFISARFEDDRI